MNVWFLLAAVASAITFAVHFFAGGRFVARPLLADETLSNVPKYTAYYCWHLVSILLAGMALAFLRAGIMSGGRELAAVCVVFATVAAVWNIVMVGRYRLNYFQFPQAILFIPVALLGGAGLWL